MHGHFPCCSKASSASLSSSWRSLQRLVLEPHTPKGVSAGRALSSVSMQSPRSLQKQAWMVLNRLNTFQRGLVRKLWRGQNSADDDKQAITMPEFLRSARPNCVCPIVGKPFRDYYSLRRGQEGRSCPEIGGLHCVLRHQLRHRHGQDRALMLVCSLTFRRLNVFVGCTDLCWILQRRAVKAEHLVMRWRSQT